MCYIRALSIFLSLEAIAYLIGFQVVPFVWRHQSSAAFHVCVGLSILSATLFVLGLVLPGLAIPEKGTKK